MSTTLNQLVRDQILAEGPQIEDAASRERYITREINSMTSSELLERISNALEHAAKHMPVRPWL